MQFYVFPYPRVPQGAKASEPKAVTWGGNPATETVYQSTDGKKIRFVIRQMATEKVVYVAAICHPGDVTPQEESKFFDGFKIVPASK